MVFIDRAALSDLLGVAEYRLAEVHEQWIEAALARGDRSREPQWSEALAVGRQSFVERVQRDLGRRGQYRRIDPGEGMSVLREADAPYTPHFEGEMGCLRSKSSQIEVESESFQPVAEVRPRRKLVYFGWSDHGEGTL